jgi:alcohol dehydrogenase
MNEQSSPFRFDYDPATVRYGPECVTEIGRELAALDCSRALVVTGRTVGDTAAVMEPIRAGLGERLGAVFAETTPQKRLGTAYDALAKFRDIDADSIVAVGGGSSLDVAAVLSVLVATDQSADAVGSELVERGTLSVPATELPPIVAVPTTLAGADLSMMAGVTADPATCPVSEPVSGGIGHRSLMPAAVCYDPTLVATTPATVLAGSAMNGFDKGIETLYATTKTPITDATGAHGLTLLNDGLRAFGDGRRDEQVYGMLTRGLILVQYGISRPDETTLSVIHAFGHGLARTSNLQQGVAHAIVAPHVLSWLFETVDGQHEVIADALGVREAEAVVDRVADIAAGLGLPRRLRDVDGPDRESFADVTAAIQDDPLLDTAPATPTRNEITEILEAAW